MDAFTEFEHEGWERVAGKYDSTWATSTRQFIAPLLDAAEVLSGASVLDVGCGPGYVSAAAAQWGATPVGIDFSREMVVIAQRLFPGKDFREGDAQSLPFDNGAFDRVVANFALLHLANPERACAEACRVLKAGGRFGFTTWARVEENPFVKLVDDAVQAHANLEVTLPPGRLIICSKARKRSVRRWNAPASTAQRCLFRSTGSNGKCRRRISFSKPS